MSEAIKQFEISHRDFQSSVENYLLSIQNQGSLFGRLICNYELHNPFYKNNSPKRLALQEENLTIPIVKDDAEIQLDKIFVSNEKQNGNQEENNNKKKKANKTQGKLKDKLEKTSKVDHLMQRLNMNLVS